MISRFLRWLFRRPAPTLAQRLTAVHMANTTLKLHRRAF